MAFFGVRVADDFAARFDAFAASRGGRSRVLRQLMATALGGAGVDLPDLGEGAGRGRSEKLTLRLKADEGAALDGLSAEAGMRRTEWAMGCLRRVLRGRPQFNREQAEALVQARQELRRIGVAMRETVKSLEQADAPVEVVAKVEALHAEVRRELAAVRAAVEGNLSYWGDMA